MKYFRFNGVVPNVPHDTIEAANKLPSPRLIKSHLPAWLLPKQVWTKKPKVRIRNLKINQKNIIKKTLDFLDHLCVP